MPRSKPSQIHRSLPACEELLQVHDGVSSLNQSQYYVLYPSRGTSPCGSLRSSEFIDIGGSGGGDIPTSASMLLPEVEGSSAASSSIIHPSSSSKFHHSSPQGLRHHRHHHHHHSSRNSSVTRRRAFPSATPLPLLAVAATPPPSGSSSSCHPESSTGASDDESEVDIEFYEDASIPRRFRRSQDFGGSFFTNAKYSGGARDEEENDSSCWEYSYRAEGQLPDEFQHEGERGGGGSSSRYGIYQSKRVSASAVGGMEMMDVDYEGHPGSNGVNNNASAVAVNHFGAGGPASSHHHHGSGYNQQQQQADLMNAAAMANAINASNKRSRIDLRYAWQFVMKAIQVAGSRSSEVPTQKQIQSKGMTTTKQQKARNFLKSIGAITVNTRTELAPRFPTLGDLRVYLESQMDPRDLLSL
eukprot:TRINITY_DN38795_c0_g1_i1.p1 TRINITY_DN38795_c0_g1~~TRINITY_DN38795_c0_g1_i1.p1  ORF type:complete len:414 (-),score=98.78 TRINITY_DN38795_c0_g1_i1:60-1301(-)